MKKTVILANRPDLVLKLEKYDLIPEGKKGGIYEGCAKKWAKERTHPYDNAEYQAMAERLPTGWEELTREEMSNLLASLREKIAKTKRGRLGTKNRGSEKMLRNLTQAAFLAISVTVTILVENGIGTLPDRDEKEKERTKEFSLEMLLHLINGTDFLTQVFRSIAETTHSSKENQEVIAELLKAAAFYLAIVTASEGSEEKLKKLFMSFRETIGQGVDVAENFVSEKLTEEAISGETAERLALSLQQARIALENEDFEGFDNALNGALRTINVTPEHFMKDIKEIRALAKKLHSMIMASMDTEAQQKTVMSQAM